MSVELVQLITAFLGSLGFALIFNLGKKYVVPGSAGGLLCWGAYLLVDFVSAGVFFSSFVASAVAALYAEVAARFLKVPATVIFVSAIIPLIPGSSLFYTMSYAVSGDAHLFGVYGMNTVNYILGITCGISLVWSTWYMVTKIYRIYIKKYE